MEGTLQNNYLLLVYWPQSLIMLQNLKYKIEWDMEGEEKETIKQSKMNKIKT